MVRFCEKTIHSVSDEIWHMPHLWWGGKKILFSPEGTKKERKNALLLCFDCGYVRRDCSDHTKRRLSRPTGFRALQIQVRELGINPLKVWCFLFHRSVLPLWFVAIHKAVVIKLKMLFFSSSRQTPNSCWISCTASHPCRHSVLPSPATKT